MPVTVEHAKPPVAPPVPGAPTVEKEQTPAEEFAKRQSDDAILLQEIRSLALGECKSLLENEHSHDEISCCERLLCIAAQCNCAIHEIQAPKAKP